MPEQLIENPGDIVLNNEQEIDEILGHPPSWFLRWGLTCLLMVITIACGVAWLIKYPDVISAQINIVTENPAIRVMARGSGRIDRFMVENNAWVEKDDLLAILDHPASLEDVQKLETFLEKLANFKAPGQYRNIDMPNDLKLGDLQTSYATLVQKLSNFNHFQAQRSVVGKVNILEEQINYLKALNQNISKQSLTLEKEVKLAEKDYQRNISLNKEGSVSDIQLEKIETAYLQYKRKLDDIENQILNNKINMEQLKAQIIDLNQFRKDGNSDRTLSIQKDVQRMKSEVDAWKEIYLINAPIAGKVSFSKIWSEQQFIRANEEVLTVVPSEGSGAILGRASLPAANSGKVELGQLVHIRLEGFPYKEYGILKTTVDHISLVPQEDRYLLEVKLPDSLITTYDKRIPFRQEMLGTADIITEDRRVIERIFDRLNSILKNS